MQKSLPVNVLNTPNVVNTHMQNAHPPDDLRHSLITRLNRFTEIIQRTYIYISDNRKKNIVKDNDLKLSVSGLRSVRKTGMDILNNINNVQNSDYDQIISDIQNMNTLLSNIIKKWGTYSFVDFLYVCFGNDYRSSLLGDVDPDLIVFLEKQFHPLRYEIQKLECKTSSTSATIVNDLVVGRSIFDIMENGDTFDAFDISTQGANGCLSVEVCGMVLYIKNLKKGVGMFVTGMMDDMDIDLVNSAYINSRYMQCHSMVPPEIQGQGFINFLQCMNMKEWVIRKDSSSMYHAYNGCLANISTFKRQSLISMSNDFFARPMVAKRDILLSLLLTAHECGSDNRYLAYFLYDLMTTDDVNVGGDTVRAMENTDQTDLINSFTWKMHELFNRSIVDTVAYTKKINKLDTSKVNLEQQICLMRTPDSVKEKALTKLREIKSKSDDNGTKARQYLDGLLKIPFGIVRREAVMDASDKIKSLFSETVSVSQKMSKMVPPGLKMNLLDIRHVLREFMEVDDMDIGRASLLQDVLSWLKKLSKKDVINMISLLVGQESVPCINMTKAHLIDEVRNTFLGEMVDMKVIVGAHRRLDKTHFPVVAKIDDLLTQFKKVTDYMSEVSTMLDTAVYGHTVAKSHVMRVVGQWISGEQVGHCFGFEGAPGCGKTSLAKYGLSKCLRDENGEARPFAMIAIGGDANGSTLHGHGYTYVGSTWGSIVQILMDKQCMNPIIFIDELDKISKTEHGRELVGILTHMLDPTQNDKFQDKYFAGVDIDLSKVLFVLSYNDPDQIDRILLDRIHRIKFSHLSLSDKIQIARKYTLPEIYSDMGLSGSVNISDEVVRFIVDNYTCEAGVRKLKEKLFEIVAEVNLGMLTGLAPQPSPVTVTIDDVKNIYFKDHNPVIVSQVPSEPRVGYATGLWANSLGQGGALPIEACFFPGGEFLRLKLTGQQGDVMQESMNIAMTLAYRLTPKERIDELAIKYNGSVKYGVHVNAPGGSAKDGPSAGSCITAIVFSLLTDRSIRARFAATGEIQLDGKITAIGGLELKILGSLKAGVVDYCYPVENQRDFDKFYEKHGEVAEVVSARFHPVETINELIELMVMEEEPRSTVIEKLLDASVSSP
jgi:ATP-dependent Lon protease